MTRFRVEHVNRYRYAHRIGLNYGEARLLPRDAPGQRVLESRLELAPEVDDRRDRQDAFGNRVTWFSLRHPHQSLSATAHSLIERIPRPLPEDDTPWEAVAARLRGALDPDEADPAQALAARECRLASPHVGLEPEALAYALPSFGPGRPLLAAVAEFTARVRADFDYRPNATAVDTPLSEVLARRHGVCQDFAHLALAGLRGLGLAARYVSGYLETTPPPGQPRQVGADASHAWISVYLPGRGWLDFDPTNGVATGAGHLTLAWGRDYGDVAPLKGVIYGNGAHGLEVGVTVTRVDEAGDGPA